MPALGVEIRQDVVTASMTAGLVGQQNIVAQDFWEYLRFGEHEMFDTVIVLAPQQLALQQLWDLPQRGCRWVARWWSWPKIPISFPCHTRPL